MNKHIAKVYIRHGYFIDAIRLEFTDGSLTPWHGANGGSETEFALQNNEHIVGVQYISDGRVVQKLRFRTSTGKKPSCEPNVSILSV